MALKLNERYPGRFDNPTLGYPQGAFKNRTTPTSKDGSYLEKEWANDQLGFLSSLLVAAGINPNGSVDEVGASQYFDALQVLSGNKVTTITATSALNKSQGGMILASASAAAVTITLPAASAANGMLEFVIRRTDAATNALAIAANGTDKIMLDTIAAGAGLASTELLFSGDYLRLRSDGAGKWWCVGQAQLPGSIDSGLVVFSAAGVSTYTVPAVLRSGRRVPKVTVIGGGGGGGRSGTAGVGSGGGGGGGVAKARCNLAGVTSVSVTVGAKGLGATVNNGQGTTGGTSSFGGFASATGGIGGAGNSTAQNAGGNTGVGVGGDILSGLGTGSSSFGADGGIGGGPGFRAQQSAIPGIPASMAGGGGSGAQSAQSGGNGADGEVTLEW